MPVRMLWWFSAVAGAQGQLFGTKKLPAAKVPKVPGDIKVPKRPKLQRPKVQRRTVKLKPSNLGDPSYTAANGRFQGWDGVLRSIALTLFVSS